MKLLFISAVVVSLLFAFSQEITAGQKKISITGKTTIDSKINEQRIRIIIVTYTVNSAACGNVLSKTLYTKGEKLIAISSLRIIVNNKSLYIPWSVYADALNPREMTISLQDGFFVLSIESGDGVESDIMRIFFDKEKIIRRVVYSALIPDLPGEETRYWIRDVEDE